LDLIILFDCSSDWANQVKRTKAKTGKKNRKQNETEKLRKKIKENRRENRTGEMEKRRGVERSGMEWNGKKSCERE
jgi:hypothetical protein